uniref:Uncharacterized protein n=2 Tax=Oryza brachyantha TaxID=4533 RepID=J3KXI9_ORYBR
MVGTLSSKQYVNVVSQGSSGPGRRFTVLTRQTAPTDTRFKATVQVGNVISDSKNFTLANNEHSERNKTSRCDDAKLVSQRPEKPSQMLANHLTAAIGKTHAKADGNNAPSDINEKPACGIQMQLKESTAAHRSTVLQSLRDSFMPNNLPTVDVKSHISVVPDEISDLHNKSASETQLQPMNHTKTTSSENAGDACGIASNQVLFNDGKHHSSSQGGDHSLYKRDKTQSGDQTSSQHAESVFSPRLINSLSSIDIVAKGDKGIKRHACPGFQELHRPSDSDKSTSVSSSTCSVLCSAPDAVQGPCSATDQPHIIISWVSECLEDGGGTTQSNSLSIPSAVSSTDITWGSLQYPASLFSGASNHCLVSQYSSGLTQRMVGGIENTMSCCCSYPSISGMANHRPEYWSGSADSYTSTGGYDAFSQDATSGMIAGMVGSSPKQPSPHLHYNDWTMGSVDSGLNCPQVDHTYPMYSLF